MKNILNKSEIFQNYGGNLKNDLNKLLDMSDNTDGENCKSSVSNYVSISKLPEYLSKCHDGFNLLSLNCQSLSSKFDSISLILEDLRNKCGFQFSVICLQETWLKGPTPDVSNFSLPGYQTFALGSTCSLHGGLICYVLEGFSVTLKQNLYKTSRLWEGLFLEISSENLKPVLLGNIYRPPKNNNNNQTINDFLTEFDLVTSEINKINKDIILVGDFNIDLLKIHERAKYSEFLENLTTLGYLPKITYPTRYAKKSASLIDQIFVKSKHLQQSSTTSGILFSSTSDHLACFTSFKGVSGIKKTPKFVTIHTHDTESVNNFKTELSSSNIYNTLNTQLLHDPNDTYDKI